MTDEANAVYSVLLALPFDRQRMMTVEWLLEEHPELKRINVLKALEALVEEGKVKFQRLPGTPIRLATVSSAHHEIYKMEHDIEVIAQSTNAGTFRNRACIRRFILRPEKDVSGGNCQLPDTADRYPTAEDAFAAGVARAKKVIDEQEKNPKKA